MTRTGWIKAFVLLFYAYCLLAIGVVQLAPDEAYYWYWAKHPDWSYLDHPPMVAYLMALSTGLGGDHEFFVRLAGLLCMSAGLAISFATVRALFPGAGRQLGWEVLLVFNLTLLFSAGAIVQTPDTPLVLCWALSMYCGARVLRSGGGRWWYGVGAALGLGLLSKYTMILLVPCMGLFLLLSPRLRVWWRRPQPYLALLLALLLFSPVIYWNFRHNWVSFGFQLHQGLTPDRKALLSKLGEYAAGQAGIITPLLFAAFAGYWWQGVRRAFRDGREEYLYLAALSFPVLLFFGLTTIVGETAEANWPAPAYVAGLMLAWAVYREHYARRRGHRIFMRAALVLAAMIGLVAHVHLHRPVVPLNPDRDPIKQFHSWDQMGACIAAVIQSRPRARGWFLMTDKGTTLAEAAFYTRNRYLGFDPFMPSRYLFLKDKDLERLQGFNAVILSHNRSDAGAARFQRFFRRVEPVKSYIHRYRGEEIAELSTSVMVGEGYLGNWP